MDGKRIETSAARNAREKGKWRSAWFAHDKKDIVRAEWHNNFAAYMDEGDLDFGDDQDLDALHQGMMLFRRLLAHSAPKQTITARYWEHGHSAVSAMVESLTSGTTYVGLEEDPVLVSLDTESTLARITEIGWATLDTRHLRACNRQAPKRSQDIIQAQDFRVRCGEQKKDYARQKFMFGTTGLIERDELPHLISNIFKIDDELHPGRQRDVILVGHSIKSDIGVCNKLGINITDFPTLKGVINTEWEAQLTLGRSGKLHEVLRSLDVPFHAGAMHNAGNDAYYALKSLMAMVATRLHLRSPSDAQWLRQLAIDHHEGTRFPPWIYTALTLRQLFSEPALELSATDVRSD